MADKSRQNHSKDDHEVIGLVNVLQLAWKNFSLYPEGHGNVIKAIANLKSAFNRFFSTNNELRLTVEKNRLLYDNKVVHEVSETSGTDDMFSLLFRDGIQWLEFQQGVSRNELIYFFSTLKKFRNLAEEAEGDIVIDLTDGNLEHISFKAVDIFWDDLPPFDFSTISSQLPEIEEPTSHDAVDQAVEPEDPGRHQTQTRSITDPSINRKLWEISPAEQEELQKMVRDEENWDNTEEIFDVLLVILRSQTDQYNFSSVLDFALEEVIETIQQGEFMLLRNFFQSLYQMLYSDASIELSVRRPAIERFFQELSNPETFELITGRLKTLTERDTDQIQILRELLLYFSPAIIHSLGPVILQTNVPEVHEMILEVMEHLCRRDLGPMEILLDHPDEKLGEKLLPLLVKLRGERSSSIFFKMSEHPSEKVRREAVQVLLEREPQSILKLSHLIDDPSHEIRRLILKGIEKQKSPVLENMLLKHINKNINSNDTDYIIACYCALGRCGSNKIIPHLSRILLEKGWKRFIGLDKPIHREGAATALALLDNQQAERVLLNASKSSLQVIRDAYHKAMKRRETSGETTNG